MYALLTITQPEITDTEGQEAWQKFQRNVDNLKPTELSKYEINKNLWAIPLDNDLPSFSILSFFAWHCGLPHKVHFSQEKPAWINPQLKNSNASREASKLRGDMDHSSVYG